MRAVFLLRVVVVPISDLVILIIRMRSPPKVVQAIIQDIVIPVQAYLTRGSRTHKRLQDKMVYQSTSADPLSPQTHNAMAPCTARGRREYFPPDPARPSLAVSMPSYCS